MNSTSNTRQNSKANMSGEFEDHALKLPLQSLPLAVTYPSEDGLILDNKKFIATRVRTSHCDTFLTICTHVRTDKFIVIQILRTSSSVNTFHLFINDPDEPAELLRISPFSHFDYERNDVIIVWLNKEGEIKITRNDINGMKKSACVSLCQIKSGEYQLLGNMFFGVDQIRAFIGDRKDAKPVPWKPSNSSPTLPPRTIQTGSSLSLICELQDDEMIPIEIEFTKNVKAEEINEPENMDDEKLCKVCLDDTANIVLLPCGHLCLCYECSLKMKNQCSNSCPICRSNIESTHKVFYA